MSSFYRHFLMTGLFLSVLMQPVWSLPGVQNQTEVSQNNTMDLYAPMMALQVTLETYAMEHQGAYPSSLKALHEAAQTGAYHFDSITTYDRDNNRTYTLEHELEHVIFMDTQTTTYHQDFLNNNVFSGRFKYLIYKHNNNFKAQYQDEAALQMPAGGAVIYAPLYPDQDIQKISGYLILRLNQNQHYYTEKGQMIYLSNLSESELPTKLGLKKGHKN